MEGDDRAEQLAALRAGLDHEMVHVDTAELYGSGAVEKIVAEAMPRGAATRCSWSPRFCLRTRRGRARSTRASARLHGSGRTTSTSMSSTRRGPHRFSRDVRRLRGARTLGQDPFVRREQLQRRRSRGRARDHGIRADRVRTRFCITSASARSSAGAPVVRGSRRRRRRLQPFRERELPERALTRRACDRRDRRGSRSEPARGCPAVSRPSTGAVHDPQGFERGARRGERGRRWAARSPPPRARSDRRGLSTRAEAKLPPTI